MARAVSAIKPSAELKQDFPALSQKVNGRAVTYLDSAASAQKPQSVIDAIGKLRPTTVETMQGIIENTRFKLPPEVTTAPLMRKSH